MVVFSHHHILPHTTFPLTSMPQTSSKRSHPVTWPKNATTHPGAPNMVGKRKHCTKAEIEADNKVAAEAKAAKEAKRQAGLQKITDLEMRIDQNDSNDVTPKPKTISHRPCPLQQTSSHLFLTLDNDVGHELSEPLTDRTIDGTEDEYHQPMDKEPTDTDVEEMLAQPKKKKVKVREAIKAIGREEMIHGEGVA